MSTRRKGFPSYAAALAQYHAINAALGLPHKDAHIGSGRHVTQPVVPTSGNCAGWTVEGCTLMDGPGPTVYLVLDAAALATDGQQPPGHVRVSLSGHVAHDRRSDERSNTRRAEDATFRRRAPVLP